jgi:transposase-like protein
VSKVGSEGVCELFHLVWLGEKGNTTIDRSISGCGLAEDLAAQVSALKKEVRELSRANDILKAASTFFGAELDRQSRK